MNELGDSLERMSFMQLLLLFGFVTTYVVAVGGLFGTAVRLRAAGLALVQAVAFAALTDPWVHGALLVAFVVAGPGPVRDAQLAAGAPAGPAPAAGRSAGRHGQRHVDAALSAPAAAGGAEAGRAAPAPRAEI